MAFVILILMAFFCLIAFRQQMTKSSVNSGSRDPVIKKLLSYYKKLREQQSELKTNAFAIGYAMKERRGKLEDDDTQMAVRILDEKGTRREGAEMLGMEVPDDFVGRAESYITVVVEGKTLMKHLG